jgi:hypothetical protein
VILDTGSSTLAVVPRVYKIADDKNAAFTSFAQLVTNGTGGWSGPVLETTLSMGSGANQALTGRSASPRLPLRRNRDTEANQPC